MKKFRWSFTKTMEFLRSRRPDLEMRQSFQQQLKDVETRLTKAGQGPLTSTWNELSMVKVEGATREMQMEELVLKNTFLNSQMGPVAQLNFAGANLPPR
mmetsp:Transcript_8442/g.6295  ORF Transcript_8442/g.6295 Transcript_8442/m.6295 type:complete len:99 (+) Transcript_8442:432-728(+)